MLVRKYTLGAEWLNNIMIVLLFFASGEFFAGLTGTMLGAGFFVISSFIIVFSYLSRVYIEKLPVFLAVHMLMFAALIFIPMQLRFKISAFIMLSVISICDILFWTGGTDRSFTRVHPILSLMFAAEFIHASLNGAVYLTRTAYVCGICYMTFYFLRTYLLNGAKFASGMLINRNTPIDEMFRHNTAMVFPLVGALGAGMFLVQSDTLAGWISAAVRYVLNCTGRLLRWLLSLIPRTEEEVQMLVDQQDELKLPDAAPLPVWLSTLLSAIEKTVTLVLFGLFIYLIIRMVIRFFRIYFNRHGYEIAMIDCEDHTETRERLRHKKRRGRGRHLPGMSAKDRIRRKYRTAVLRMCRHGYILKRHDTPKERLRDAEKVYKGRGAEDFETLTAAYETVRYSK